MLGTAEKIVTYLLAEIREGTEKEWELKERKRKRTLTQNAYYWQLLTKVAQKLRLTNTELHNQMLAEFGCLDMDIKTVIMRDDIDWRKLATLHLRPTTSTRTLDDGRLYRVYFVMRGSHTYNTQEMSRLVDGLIEEAKAQDIETLPPYELAAMRGKDEGRQTTDTACQS